MNVLYARADGTFVIEHNGMPYHVLHDDPMYSDVVAAADGKDFPPEPVPEAPANLPTPAITRRQCARELFERSMITGPEMVAMTRTGTPPAMIETIFASMPEPDQWVARADFAADQYERSNPLLIGVMTSTGATPEQIDDFFIKAATR